MLMFCGWITRQRCRRRDGDERGASLVEYALLVALIAVRGRPRLARP